MMRTAFGYWKKTPITLWVALLHILSVWRSTWFEYYYTSPVQYLFFALLLIALSLLLLFFTSRLLKPFEKADLGSAFVAFTLLFFVDIRTYFGMIPLVGKFFDPTQSAPAFAPVLIVIVISGIFLYALLRRISVVPPRLMLYFKIVFFIFCLVESVKLISIGQYKPTFAEAPATDDSLVMQQPDVWFITCDAYTSNKSLNKYFAFSNHAFTDSLKSLGLLVPDNAMCNYNQTLESRLAALSMNYLNTDACQAKQLRARTTYMALSESTVPQFFSHLGYTIINLGIYPIAGSRPYYRIQNENLYGRSIAGPLMEKYCIDRDEQSFAIINSLDSMQKLAKNKGACPRFILAHLMIPHAPYHFGQSGEHMPQDYAMDDKNAEKYLAQIMFLNKELLKLISSIQSGNNRNAVIIIEGDHGSRYFNDNSEALSVFRAIHLPCNEPKNIDSLTTVNMFRLVLNSCFGQHLPLLKNRYYPW